MKTKFAFVAAALAVGLAGPMFGAGAAYAQCMHGEDFERAYRAFVEKRVPVFQGN